MAERQYKIKNDILDKYPKTCNSLKLGITFYLVSTKSKNTILSLFTSLLASTTPLVVDLLDRSSLSILVIPNTYLATYDHLSPPALADIFPYHVLLHFLS
ncbi:hypothetical protein AAZX31_18G139200 [Glycine max]